MSSPPPITQPDDVARFAAALAGQYAIEREIGRGGMGVVFLARDLKLDRHVAIKTLPPHLAADPLVRERFLREARTAARLSHHNIVPIHRADEIDGRVFFVMGFVDGESLAQRIRTRGRLDPREVVHELADVADALRYAHDHHVVHRDVKAENILIERGTGRALVTDFGIARLAEATPLTSTGQVLGTVYYLSPEQVSGDGVDARSDVYSLGVVGFFALAGRFPFDAELASAVLVAHVTKPPPKLLDLAPDVPRALAEIIDRCLAKVPAARYQSCDELYAALLSIREEVDREMSRRGSWSAAAGATPKPSLVSDTEAQAIWQRAAELQALTSAAPRPPEVIAPRDAAKDAARTSGFSRELVREAAAEAGIPERFVEQAMVERGIGVAAPPPAVTDRSPKANPFAGARTRLEFEAVLEGEMPADDYDLLVDRIRRETGETGTLGSVGRSFTWQSSGQGKRNLQVSVFPRGGKTTIRVSENIRGIAVGLFGGIMGGYGGGTTGVWIGIAATMHKPLIGAALWLGNLVLAYCIARGILGIASNRRGDAMQRLLDGLVEQARESIAAAQTRLPAPRR